MNYFKWYVSQDYWNVQFFVHAWTLYSDNKWNLMKGFQMWSFFLLVRSSCVNVTVRQLNSRQRQLKASGSTSDRESVYLQHSGNDKNVTPASVWPCRMLNISLKVIVFHYPATQCSLHSLLLFHNSLEFTSSISWPADVTQLKPMWGTSLVGTSQSLPLYKYI